MLEILRGKSGQLSGALVDLLTMTKGIPLTYNRDLQDDKRSLFRTLDCLNGIFSVLPALLSRVEIDEEKANRGFADGLILATDVAEYLVLRGVPFRSAHEKVGHAVRWCIENNRPMDGLTLAEWQRLIPEAEAGLLPLLSPRRSMERRDTVGGTSPRQVRAQIARARERLAVYESEMAEYGDKLPDML